MQYNEKDDLSFKQWQRNDTLNHLTRSEMAGEAESSYMVGHLEDSDIQQIEAHGHEVVILRENGLTSYKVIFKPRKEPVLQRTLAIIKPDAVKARNVGKILNMIETAGFYTKAIRKTELSVSHAEFFYDEHKGKPFFETLVNFMSSGPIIVMILEKENAIEDFRKLMGATKLEERKPNTIRYKFGTTQMHNSIHGSDSEASAKREIEYFFIPSEIF